MPADQSKPITLESLAATVGSQGAQITAIADLMRDLRSELHSIGEKINSPSDLSKRTAENVERLSMRVTAPQDWKGIVGLQLTGVLVIIAIGGVIAAGFTQRLASVEADGIRSRSMLFEELDSDNERERLDAYNMGLRDARLTDVQTDIRAIWDRLETMRQNQRQP